MNKSVHIVSQTKHASKWKELRSKEENITIISSWIFEPLLSFMAKNESITLINQCLEEAATADFSILYAEEHDVLKFSLLQVGAALVSGKTVLIVGDCQSITPALRNHPKCISSFDTIHKALMFIKKSA